MSGIYDAAAGFAGGVLVSTQSLANRAARVDVLRAVTTE